MFKTNRDDFFRLVWIMTLKGQKAQGLFLAWEIRQIRMGNTHKDKYRTKFTRDFLNLGFQCS